MGKKDQRLGMVFILLAIAVTVILWWQSYRPEKHTEEFRVSDLSDRTESALSDAGAETVLSDVSAETEQEEKIAEIQDPFEITGISDETYEILGISSEELETEIREWTLYNGYSHAVGAEFYPDMNVNPADEKYTFTLQLVMDENDNRKEAVLLFLDYYKDKGKSVFHQ